MRRLLLLGSAGTAIIIIPFVAASLLFASPSPPPPSHWGIPVNISNSPSPYEASGPRIAADNNKHLHIIWIDDKTGSGDLYYTKSTDEGTNWSTFDPLTTTLPSSPGDIAVEPDGSVHAAWVESITSQNLDIQYAEKINGVGWVTSTVNSDGKQSSPAIAVGDGYVHAVWSWRSTGNFNIYYSHKEITATQWPTATFPTYVYSSTLISTNPEIALDSSGNVHVVWQEGSVPGSIYIYYSRTEDGGITWTPPITVTQGITDSRSPAIAIGGDNRIHVAWGRLITNTEQYVGYVNFSNTITTTDPITPTTITETVVEVSAAVPYNVAPAIAISGTDEIHIVWHGKKPGDLAEEIYYTHSGDGGQNWSTPLNISRDPASPSAVPDIALTGNMIHVVWQGKDGNGKYQVMYVRGFPFAVYLPMTTKGYAGG